MLKLYFLLFFVAALFLSCVSIGFVDENNIVTCGGERYTSVSQICENDTLKNPCGNVYYNQKIQFCAEQDNKVYDKCGGRSYDTENQKCEDSIVKTKCGSNFYNSLNQDCCNNIIFTLETQKCENDIILNKCGNNFYNSLNQDCCNNMIFTLETQKCENGIILNKCGDENFNPFLEYCINDVVKNKEEFIDDRDGKKYKYVPIGNQVWMAENLRYEASNIKCYNDNYDNCQTFGVFYHWANTACPSGWHLPNDAEWNKLIDFIGDDVGTKLKANSSLWISGKGTDDFSFTALPNGYYKNDFEKVGEEAVFWSVTAGSYGGAIHLRYLKYNNNVLNSDGHLFYFDDIWANVRCIND